MADDPIVTLTLNPALDVSTSTQAVTPDHKLRCGAARREPGGGGINVTRVCRRLGRPSRAVVPVGGPNGAALTELLAAEGIDALTVPIEGETRQSLSVTEDSTGRQYRFVLPGPALSDAEVERCCAAVAEAMGTGSGACLVISGSLPAAVDPAIISELVAAVGDRRVLVDTSGPALAAALQSGAYLVKPSARELAAAARRELRTEADIIEAATEIHRSSTVTVLVASIGAGGAVVVDGDGVHRIRTPTVQVRSTVGAGDSMVAGLATGLSQGLPVDRAAALGVAAGTAAVLTDGTELCRVDDIERLLPSVVIT
jgi:6-phosphofructokinase 2